MSRTNTTRFGAFALSLLLVGFLVVTGSRAAFTATTDNTGNSWAAGTVHLFDDAESVMFDASGLAGGDVLENCIEVTYDGTLAANVVLYAANLTPGLDEFLDLRIEIGNSAGWAGTATADGEAACDGTFSSEDLVYDGTLADFALDYSAFSDFDFASGDFGWDTTDGLVKTYYFVVTVQDDNAAQGLDSQVDFVWEAQNQ
jgi:hypothetical protein